MVVGHPVMGDGEQPAGEAPLLPVILQALQRLGEYRCRQILGILLISNPPVDVAIDTGQVTPVEGDKGGSVLPGGGVTNRASLSLPAVIMCSL